MMEAQLRKKRRITQTERKGNVLFLHAEAGLIRIWPQTETIMRISYTQNGQFGEKQGAEYTDLSASRKAEGLWNYEEGADEIFLETAALRLVVSKKERLHSV